MSEAANPIGSHPPAPARSRRRRRDRAGGRGRGLRRRIERDSSQAATVDEAAAVLRHAPGGDPHTAAGSADVRGLRPHDHVRRRAARPAAIVVGETRRCMTAGTSHRIAGRPAGRAAAGHRRGGGAAALAADDHLRAGAERVSAGRQRPLRPRLPATAGAVTARPPPRRPAAALPQRRRHLRPGLRRRSAGGVPRRARPGPAWPAARR